MFGLLEHVRKPNERRDMKGKLVGWFILAGALLFCMFALSRFLFFLLSFNII